jgi:uncharacterized protein involved in exopolysaccharide biosynthesis
MLSFTVLALLLSAGALLAVIWMEIVPEYRAEARLRVHATIPYLVFQTEDKGAIPRYESFIKAQVATLKSSVVLDRVLGEPEVQQTRWYREAPLSPVRRWLDTPPASPRERLVNRLVVRPQAESETLQISFWDPRSDDARTVLEAVVKSFLAYFETRSERAGLDLDSKIMDRYQVLKNEVAARNDRILALQATLGAYDPDEKLSRMGAGLDTIRARLSDHGMKIDLLKWKQQRIMDLPVETGTPGANSASGEWIELLGRPCQDFQEGLRMIKTQLAQAEYEQQLLETEYAQQQGSLHEFIKNAQELKQELDARNHKRELLHAVEMRQDQRKMEQGVFHPIEVISRATVPAAPSRDRRILFTAIVLVLCILSIRIVCWLFRGQRHY